MQMIQYKAPVLTPTASGGTIEAYVLNSTDFAHITTISDRRENIGLQGLQATQKEFKVRYRESLRITTKWIIVYQGVDYKIITISRVEERNFWYKIIANGI